MGILSRFLGRGNRERQKNAKFQELERQLAGNPDMIALTRAAWLTSRGNHYGQQGQLNEAIADFKEAIQLKPDHTPAHMSLAVAYREKGMFEEGLAVLNAAPRKTGIGGKEIGGTELDVLTVMISIYLLMGDKPRTLECAKKAIQAANAPERTEYLAAAASAGVVTEDDSETINGLQELIRELEAS